MSVLFFACIVFFFFSHPFTYPFLFVVLSMSCLYSPNTLHRVASYLCLLPELPEGQGTTYEMTVLLELLVSAEVSPPLPHLLPLPLRFNGCRGMLLLYRSFSVTFTIVFCASRLM